MNDFIQIESLCRIFRDLSLSVDSNTNVKDVLDSVARKTVEILTAKGALLRLLNLETQQLELCAAFGLSAEYLSKGPVASQKMITDLCRLNKVIIIDDILSDNRVLYPREAYAEGIRMIMDLPLTIQSHVVGILRVYFDRKRFFSTEELRLVIFIAEQSSGVIDKARLVETHQSEYHQLALQTEKLSALGRMAAGIAHEINNPLTGILLYSTNLLKKSPAEGPLKEGLEVIVHETIRCRSIIKELLEFSRDKEPKKSLSNVNQIISKALTILENEFRLQHIRIEKKISEDLPDILLDANQMEQVFVNLLLNAVEAVQHDGTISVSSRMDIEKKSVQIEISDSGPGIPPEHLNKIFEPFFSTKPKGTGLGLAVTYGIVRNHQGNIRLTSRPGESARFTIELPLLAEVPARIATG